MKVVGTGNQKTINLTAAQPIRCDDSSKYSPAEQREGVATPFFRPASFLSAEVKTIGDFIRALINFIFS